MFGDMTNKPDLLLTVAQAARYVRMSPDTIRRWADAGLLPVTRTPTGHRRFRTEDLDTLLASGRVS